MRILRILFDEIDNVYYLVLDGQEIDADGNHVENNPYPTYEAVHTAFTSARRNVQARRRQVIEALVIA